MTPDDLAAIRARDAEWDVLPDFPLTFRHTAPEGGTHMGVQACADEAVRDRRDLLAEVDRLRRMCEAEEDDDIWNMGAAAERARALPVIKAARRIANGDGWDDRTEDDWYALRAALAEYDR